MAWCFEDEQTADTDHILNIFPQGLVAHVPSLWRYEALNVLLLAQREGRISPNDAASIWSKLQALPIKIDELKTNALWTETFRFAQTYKLTIYDAAYLELATRRGSALATLDKQLRAAAISAGIELIPKDT